MMGLGWGARSACSRQWSNHQSLPSDLIAVSQLRMALAVSPVAMRCRPNQILTAANVD